MADLQQANKLLAIARRLSRSATVERDIARRKFWDAVDDQPDDLMLVGNRESEMLRLRAERDALQAENTNLNRIKNEQQREIVELRRTRRGSDDEFEQLLRENGQLRQDYERLRKELRFLTEVPRPPPVPRRS